MPSKERPAVVAPEDVPHLAHRALKRLADPKLTRDAAVSAAVSACDKTRCGWVKRAFSAGALEVRCLGRFDLENPILEDVPWPSVAFLVRASVQGLDGPVVKSAALCLHVPADDPHGWAVTDSEVVRVSSEGGRLVLNGRPFCGDPDGPASLLNGDGAVSPSRQSGSLPQSPRIPADRAAGMGTAERVARGNSRVRKRPRTRVESGKPLAAPCIHAAPPSPPSADPLALRVRMLEALVRLLS